MNYNFMNQDFDPSRLTQVQSIGNSGLIRGRWTGVSAWKNAAHRAAFLAGYAVSPLWSFDFPNGITDEGIHYVLDTSFRGTAADSTWFAGLIDNAGFSGVNPSDVMSSHSGWTENQGYDESVRQTLAFSAAATRSISDSVSFTMNGTITIKGLFITGDNTKGGTTGILFSTALFGTPPALVAGNVLTANYSLSD